MPGQKNKQAASKHDAPVVTINHLNEWLGEKQGLAFLRPIIETILRRMAEPADGQ